MSKNDDNRNVPVNQAPHSVPAVVHGLPPTVSRNARLLGDLRRLAEAVKFASSPGAEYELVFVDGTRHEFGLKGSAYWAKRVEAMVPQMAKTKAEVAELRRPASVEEILAVVGALSGSLPAAANIDGKIWTEMVGQMVIDQRPRMLTLIIAVDTLASTLKFLPSPAEVVGAIRAAKRASKELRYALNIDHPALIAYGTKNNSMMLTLNLGGDKGGNDE